LDELGSSSNPSGDRAVWKKIWRLPVLPKIHNFI
jgi:hypothetical protein